VSLWRSLACQEGEEERRPKLTSCQTVGWSSTSSGSVPKLSENISDRRMVSSHPWSDSHAQGFFRLLFSREMFPDHREEEETQVCAASASLAAQAFDVPPKSAS
jgi:hypothetical protein